MYDKLARIPPMVIFIAVGALLFAADSLRNSRNSDEDQILVTAARVDLLEQALQQRYGRRASHSELSAELKAYIDEELLYREAIRLGLHQTDEVVRRRLAQSMAFILEGRADLERPSENDLRALYDAEEPEANMLTRVDFRHVFFSSDRHKGQSEPAAEESLTALKSGEVAATEIGDPFLLGQNFRALNLQRIADQFGQVFADAIAGSEPGVWSGPIASKYGEHLVLVERIEEASDDYFERQRDMLVNAWRIKRRREVREEALDRLRQDVRIDVESTPALQISQL